MHSLQEVQAKLKDLGLYTGIADGINGPKTKAAVAAFQKSVGLVEDGIPGNQTQAHLFPVGVDPSLGRDITPPAAEPEHIAPIWPRQPEVWQVFGQPGTNFTTITVPYPMRMAWGDFDPLPRFQIHEKVADSALRCLIRVADTYDEDARRDLGLDLWGGCVNVRKMRGGTSYSMHSWGIAIDFDPERNQLKWGADRARLARPDASKFFDIWEEEGWVSLGRARNFDWMHVQAARL